MYVYDAFAHERSERGELPFLPPPAAREFVADVRRRVLALLHSGGFRADSKLLDEGFVFGIVVQHELQHIETMGQTLQLGGLPGPTPGRPPRVTVTGDILDAGVFAAGTDDAPWAYDNERPAHDVDVGRFRVDRALVTNADYAAFVAAGGYAERSLWSDEGWEWVQAEQAEAPL